MHPETRTIGGRPTRIANKLLMITVIFAIAIAAIGVITVQTLREQEMAAAQADAMGRQRFLVVRYYADVLHTAMGDVRDHAAVKRVFDANLQAMLEGGEVDIDLTGDAMVLMPPAVSPQIAAKLREQREAANRLEAMVARYLALPPAERADPRVLDDLARQRVAVASLANDAARRFSAYTQSRVQLSILIQIAVGLAGLVAGGIAAWLISRSIVAPLQRCVAMAQGIIAGDLRQPPLPIRSNDEVGLLTATFNDMLAGLRGITSETRDYSARLATAVAEMSASIQEQAVGARQQAAAVQEITTTVEEIGQSAQQVSDMARDVGSAADTVSGAGVAGLQTVKDAASAMEAIRSQTESVAETIVALSERTQAIGEIIATVNEIAEQSNLLALNAAIEAADAGDQGRRFSVVANEIKSLADQAKDATRQVRSILEQTQKNISTSVMLTEEALKRATAGREKALAAEDVIRRMTENLQENSGSFQQVVGATGQQQIGLEQIAQGIQQIRQASMQTAASTDELAKAATNLNQLGEALTRLMEKYRL